MKFERTDVWGFEHAIRGMRNPLASWSKSDSERQYESPHDMSGGEYILGKNDLNLAQRLINGGTEHRKFMRQIMVSVDITAPMYWWSEFDTYKVGTTANSTSKMHKLASTPITLDCFETDDYDKNLKFQYQCTTKHLDNVNIGEFSDIIIRILEGLRQKYLETKDKRYWKELVRWLPESWLQTRTVTFNYENLRSMYFQRRNHKLSEWHSFVDWLKTLPYSEELITFEKETKENDKI